MLWGRIQRKRRAGNRLSVRNLSSHHDRLRSVLDVEHGAAGQSDMRMNSAGVSAAVSVPRPGKERIQTVGGSEERK